MSLDPIAAVADLAKTAVNAIWPDRTEQEKAQLAAAVALVQGQLAINQEEASHTSLFVAGWRPAVGWACALAFAWNWCGLPMAKVLAELLGSAVLLEPANLSEMMPVLLALLGLGALRTTEKIKGAEGNR